MKNYQTECLKHDVPQDKIDSSKFNLNYFYLNCNAFPNFSKFIWKEIIDFLPDFFSPEELKKIVSFYYMVNELQDDAIFLHLMKLILKYMIIKKNIFLIFLQIMIQYGIKEKFSEINF